MSLAVVRQFLWSTPAAPDRLLACGRQTLLKPGGDRERMNVAATETLRH
jgi:hypothetical protein